MKKSFKKFIAALLATLMVVTAFPMSALALPDNKNKGQYDIDIQLQFGTFHKDGTDWQDKTVAGTVNEFSMSGLYDVPLDMANARWDAATGEYKIGGLYIDKDKANEFNTSLDMPGDLNENIEYGVGDLFTVTLMLNISDLNMTMMSIDYGDTIEPAGAYSYKSGRNTFYALGSESDRAKASSGTWIEAGNKMLGQQTITGLYSNVNGNDIDDSAETSNINIAKNTIDINFGGKPINTAGLYNDYFVDPNTGNALGYTYDGVILGTFVFKIVKEGDISFKMYDPENTNRLHENGYVIVNFINDGAGVFDYNTYAKNIYGLTDDEIASGIENPGSRKLTLMKHNVNTSEDVCDHATTASSDTVTKEPTCTETGLKDVKVTCTKCNQVISETKDVVIDTVPHEPGRIHEFVELEPTCTTPGWVDAWNLCQNCDHVCEGLPGREIPALGHDLSETAAAVDATCGADGKTAVMSCSRCDHTEGGEAITDRPAHVWEETTPAQDATCTANAVTAVETCKNCGATQGGEEVAETATGHQEYTYTSNNDGTHTATCTKGDDTAVGNCTFGEWVTIVPAVYPNTGLKERTCTLCSYKETDIIEAPDCIHDGTTTKTLNAAASVAPTCTAPGKNVYDITCDKCTTVFDTEEEPLAALDHDMTKVVTEAKEATCTEAGNEEQLGCTRCDEVNELVVLPALGHDMTKVVTEAKAATCTETGNEEQLGCTRCDKVNELVVLPALGHDMTKVVTEAKEATCTEAGNEEQLGCTRCDEVNELVVLPALGHDMTKVVTEAKAATCTETGNEEQMGCTRCDKVNELVVLDMIPHTAGEPVVTTVPAEIDKEGSITTVVNCAVCGTEMSKNVEKIDALVGYTVTVDRTDLGYVTLAGNDVTTGGSAKFVEGTKVTLTATPVDGATFVGWTANGTTLVSTDTTFTTTVLANIVFTPVFEVASDNTFTVEFVDAYGNVVAIFTDVTADTVADIEVPAVPNRPGYTSAGWLITDLTTIKSSAVITAQYEKNNDDLYTVTVPEGATVMVNGAVVEAPYEFPFDTKVTVSLAGAETWVMAGTETPVGYGEEFSFYVTADVDLDTAAGITATPSVALIGKESIGSAGAVQAMFKATRTMAPGCKFVQAGFIYGAGNIGDAKLANVNNSTIKASYVKTSVEQFSLTYGLRSQSGTITARAFLAYVDVNGETQVVYTPVETYTYGA